MCCIGGRREKENTIDLKRYGSFQVSALLGLEGTQARKVLREMILEGILIAEGNNWNRRYRRAE